MQSTVSHSAANEMDNSGNDLGPLAWVLDELRKSLESASKALKRFVRDAESAKGSDLAAIDASQLRIARQQLHLAVGALEMVGMAGPALVLRSMESAVQKFVQQPEHCTPDAAARIERASFALTEYLEGVLADKPVSSVSLFPQYREVQEITKAERIHPADLWPAVWRWIDPELSSTLQPVPYSEVTKKTFDLSVLQIMKGSVTPAAKNLRDLSLGFSINQTDVHCRIFWKIVAAYFEAVMENLLGFDIYVRRAASRILLQYSSLTKGETGISERLILDLLFFCAQAIPKKIEDTPVLSSVRQAYKLNIYKPVNYDVIQFGRFDPALLAQARKRISSAKEMWSSLCAGDTTKFKSVVDQFSLLSDSLVKLHPASEPLAVSLTLAVDTAARTNQTPRLELAMEVATSVLYLEAAFEDLDPNDPQLAIRTSNLAARLEAVRVGGNPQPLEEWMEELYRRVSDKQTMGSVVGELRISLNEIEKLLDSFFRQLSDKRPLQPVIQQLSQMRGVLSVLGLDHASHAVVKMKVIIENMLSEGFDTASAQTNGTFEQLGNNLGALAFMIDMLNYQPLLAKKLFIYDEESGELKSLISRSKGNSKFPDTVDIVDTVLPVEDVSSFMPVVATLHPAVEISEVIPFAIETAVLLPPKTQKISTVLPPDNSTYSEITNKFPLIETPVPITPPSQNFPTPQLASSKIDEAPSLDTSEDDELLEIFIEEAREVTGNALESLASLKANPMDTGALTVLRRAFHTLKGSSRMVGLEEFGLAGWSLEQLLNTWLADQKSATLEFCAVCSKSIHAFELWIGDIANRQHSHWKAAPFIAYADDLRLNNIYDPAMDLSKPVVNVEKVEAPVPSLLNTAPVKVHFPAVVVAETVSFDNFESLQPVEFSADATPDLKAFELPVQKALSDFQSEALKSEFDIESFLFDSASNNPSNQLIKLPIANLGNFDILDNYASADFTIAPIENPDNLVIQNFETLNNASLELPAFENPSDDALSDEDLIQFFSPGSVAVDSVSTDHFESHVAAEPNAVAENIESIPESAPFISVPDSLFANETLNLPESSEAFLQDNEDEQVRVIGTLRISIPLYNVYLNEADEWSRCLVTEMAEWALDHTQPVSDTSVFLSHSLAGSSATVGFQALSEVARALEHALENSQVSHSANAVTCAQDFVNAADEIRRLLHQFAAGFIVAPDKEVLARLKSINFLKSFKQTANPTLLQNNLQLDAENLVMVDKVDVTFSTVVTDTIDGTSASYVQEVQAPPQYQSASTQIAEEATYTVLDFQQYGSEFMRRLGSVLRQWSARPDNTSAPQEVLRVLKAFYESASQGGAITVALRVRGMETQILSFDSLDQVTSIDIESLLGRFNALQVIFDVQNQISQTANAAAHNVASTAITATVPAESVSLEIEVVPVEVQTEVSKNILSPEADAEIPVAVSAQFEIHEANEQQAVQNQLPTQAPLLPVPKDEIEISASESSILAMPNERLVVNQAAEDIDGEEIDAIDAVDMDLFFIFEEECDELMPQLGTGLRQWMAQPVDRNLRLEVLRVLHTLKGSARLAGALRLGEMTHHMESEIEFLGSDDAANQDFNSLLARFDAMQHTFENLRVLVQTPGFDSVAYSAAEQTRKTSRNYSSSRVIEPEISSEFLVESLPLSPASVSVLGAEEINVLYPDTALPLAGEPAPKAVEETAKVLVPAPQAMMMKPLRQAATATIRVRAQLLDRMVTQAGEVMITRSRLEAELNQLRSSLTDMSGNLDRLRQQLRDIELQAETQMQSRLAQAKEAQAGFDPLEFDRFTRVQELTRMMAESVNDVATVQRTLQRTLEATEDDLIAQARQTRELQRDLLKTRMVEFESISDRLYRVVRQASKDSGKQVKLDLLGGTIEMDRGMLDRMTPAFEHLLRNCVAHGVEDAATRQSAGKPLAGLITVHLHQAGNDVSVDFSDDGAGLNLPRIREKALSLGMIKADQVVSDQEVANLIFMPGFTTASQITELAGRGIGMDVVRTEIDALGGRIETLTEAGKGTQFKLVLPLTTAVTQVVMIRSGTLAVGVPASLVETVRRLSIKELEQAYSSGSVEVAGEPVPFFWSGTLLQTSHRTADLQTKTSPIVIFRSAAQRIAMHVDDVLGNQEVVVKNLGPQLSRLPGLAGMSVLASGAVVLIYNPVALATVYGPQAKLWSAEQEASLQALAAKNSAKGGAVSVVADNAASSPSSIPLVLVVDDSITVRRVTQRFLQREGFRVVMAADGLQALEKLEGELPSVILSDIEMPRMDGFDLARNIRAHDRLKGLPIIMITSRIAEKHREYAKELGVDHYLGKPYSEEILAALVRNYCGLAAVVPA